MNARLVVIDPQKNLTPTIPLAVIENEGKILLCGDDWATPLAVNHLDEVTATEVREAMHLAGSRKLWIAEMRPLPEAAWISEEMLNWLACWEAEARKAWQQNHRLSKVS